MRNHSMRNADISVIDWLNCIWKTDLPSNAKYVACYLRKFMNSNQDMAWPSYARMVDETNLSKGCIAKYLGVLQESGWLLRISGNGYNTTYIAKLPKIIEDKVKEIDIKLNEGVHLLNRGCSSGEQVGVHLVNTNKQVNKPVSKQSLNADQAQLVHDGFHKYFWPQWTASKKLVGSDNGPKEETFQKKFKPLFNKPYFESNTEDEFKDEINSMCDFVANRMVSNGEFNPMINTYPGKFFNQKQWRD